MRPEGEAGAKKSSRTNVCEKERDIYGSCEREGDRKVTVQTSQLSLPLRLLYADPFFPRISVKNHCQRPDTRLHQRSRSICNCSNGAFDERSRKITERSRESRIETVTDQLIPLFRSLTHAKRSPAIFNRYYSSVKRFVRIEQESNPIGRDRSSILRYRQR